MEKIKREIVVSLSASILIISMLASIPIGSSGVEMESTQYGPRAPGLDIYFYTNPDYLFEALVNNQTDLMDWPLTRWQYEAATQDPNIILAPVVGLDTFQFDLNNNYTILSYPGVRSPTNSKEFRQALAYLVDKDRIVYDVLGGLADRIDVPIPAFLRIWWNPSVTGWNYSYQYNPTQAANLLDAVGFVQGTTPNPYYDPYYYPWSAQYLRKYPVGWPGRENGPDLDPIMVCIRNDNGQMRMVGELLVENMRALGIPVDQIEAPKAVLNNIVKGYHDYHVYIGDWFRIGPEPPGFIYSTYHDDFDFPGGTNYVTGKNASNLPNYPLLNQYLEEMWYAQTLDDAIAAAKRAQGFIVENCINIPLWSTNSYYAYRNLAGVVNMEGVGPYNIYTLMNAYRTDDPGQPIRIGIWPPPSSMNPLYVDSYDQRLLLPLQDEGGVSNPYNLAKDQPWQTRDWKVDEWYDPEDGLNKTRLTIWLNPNIVWIEPGTGSVIAPLSGEDIELSMWYYYQTIDSPYSNYYALKETWFEIWVNSSLIEVNINLDVNQPLQMAIEGWKMIIDRVCKWIEGPAVTSEHRSWNDLDSNENRYLPLPDEGIGAPVKVISVLKNGTSVPAKIRKVPGKKGTGIYVLPPTEYHPGDKIEAFYLAKAEAYGFFPCGLPWQQTMISKGPYYLIEFVEGAGGHAFYQANRHYFMPTPPLGEVDWGWYWVGTTKPRSGYFEIDIFDVVEACVSYGSSGRGIPDPKWIPGADLAIAEDYKPGEIDIFDVVIVCINYGKKFGQPPNP